MKEEEGTFMNWSERFKFLAVKAAGLWAEVAELRSCLPEGTSAAVAEVCELALRDVQDRLLAEAIALEKWERIGAPRLQ